MTPMLTTMPAVLCPNASTCLAFEVTQSLRVVEIPSCTAVRSVRPNRASMAFDQSGKAVMAFSNKRCRLISPDWTPAKIADSSAKIAAMINSAGMTTINRMLTIIRADARLRRPRRRCSRRRYMGSNTMATVTAQNAAPNSGHSTQASARVIRPTRTANVLFSSTRAPPFDLPPNGFGHISQMPWVPQTTAALVKFVIPECKCRDEMLVQRRHGQSPCRLEFPGRLRSRSH